MRSFFLADSGVQGLIPTQFYRIVAPANAGGVWAVFQVATDRDRNKLLGGTSRKCTTNVRFIIAAKIDVDDPAAAVQKVVAVSEALDAALKTGGGSPLDGYKGTWGDQKIDRALFDPDAYDERFNDKAGQAEIEMMLVISHKPAPP